MNEFWMVGLGGAIGSVCRFALSRSIQALWGAGTLPLGTLTVNLAGSFLIGLASGWLHGKSASPMLPLLLITGFLGGFTTFSAFSLENLHLLRTGDGLTAVLYIAGSVSGGLFLAWAGYRLAV